MTCDPLSEFDESRFPPVDEEQYINAVEYGREIMAERSVAIVGLARNVATTLPYTMARIEHLGDMFRDYSVVIYENDSRDDTPQILRDWADQNPKVDLVSEVRSDPVNRQVRCLQRASRMAYYRNQCRLRVLEKHSDVNNVIVVDTDLGGGWSYDGVAHTFSSVDTWDFVGSNGILFKNFKGQQAYPMQFDVWAWRWQGSFKPCWAPNINPRRWQRGQRMVHLYSCFGGMGIYRVEAMQRCSYDGSDCEHVPLHRKMRAHGMGRIFMNPSQVVVY